MNELTSEMVDALTEMFGSYGWQLFMEEATKNLENINTLDGVQGEQTLGFRQGQIAMLRSVLGYEDIIRTAVDQQEEEAEEVVQ